MKQLLTIYLLGFFCVSAFADEPAVHGMLLFGKNANYISHLPMFHTPHDYQLIATVELAELGTGKTLGKYEIAKKNNTIFTIVPKLMDLSEVIAGSKTSFEVTIFRGHFERGGTPIGPALVTIKQILVGEKIAREKGPSSDFLTFGSAGEYYVAHTIKGQPTYDAIYASSAPTKVFFPPCGRARCPEPIITPIQDSALPITLMSDSTQFSSVHPQNVVIGSTNGINVEVKTPFYVEYRELAH